MSANRIAFAVLVAVLVAIPLAAPQFWVTLGNYIGLYSIVALGLVLLTGVAGQTSFGQAAFVVFCIYLYFRIRNITEGSRDVAVEHAQDVVDLERDLGIYFEESLQEPFLGRRQRR